MKRLSLILCALLYAPALHATPQTDAANPCTDAGGNGDVCEGDDDCAFNAYATQCVEHSTGDVASRRCRIPCESAGALDHALCATGESCRRAADGNAWCQAARFRMDLNLLDQCITHFLLGQTPALGSSNDCSLEANLNRLLDQDGNARFDIFDLDLCVLAFLEQPRCNRAVEQCPSEDLVYCEADEDCGRGLYCDPERSFCQRDCGFIESRELGVGTLERPCSGFLKACDFARGRCVDAQLEGTGCTVDRECPNGSYCFLGQCQPQCFRSIDCPDAGWVCTANNRCRPLPPADAADGFVFVPEDYALLFARDTVTLDALNDSQANPLLIMDLVSKREVVDNPSIGFGYRVEVTYDRKIDPLCLRDPAQWSDAERAECLIDDTEEFVTPLAPFGSVFATGMPSLPVALNSGAAERLSPGRYSARVRAIFDNGNSDSFVVFYEKTTPSGEYDGSMNVHVGAPQNRLNTLSPIPLGFKLDVRETRVIWHELMQAEGLADESVLRDLNEGFLVHGLLHADDSLPFVLPGVTRPGDNEIPFKGIYSPRYGRMRLVTVIELEPDLCVGETGACTGEDGVSAGNPFARRVRRYIEFIGTYDDLSRRFFGIYRERISGLIAPSDVTVDGDFVLQQRIPDEQPVELPEPLLPAGAAASVAFPEHDAVLGQVEADIESYCAPALAVAFADTERYEALLGHPAFPPLRELVEFKQLLQDGIDSIGADPEDYLTLFEYLQGQILLCDGEALGNAAAQVTEDGPATLDPAACVDESLLRCGLALYRKAILRGFVEVDDLGGAAGGSLELFCSATVPTSGCNLPATTHPALRTLQEHNRFHQELSQATRFTAGREISDAFFALYRHRLNPFTSGTALAYKQDKLRSALESFDSLVELIVGTPAAAVLFDWPMDRFQGRGQLWLTQMHGIVRDRLDALQELVDLRRRVFAGSERSDQMLAQHLAQDAYLTQVYLIALQRRWQGEDFAYAGQASLAFAQVQDILLRLNHAKNPLGITPGQVFFENSDPTRSNWRNYLAQLVGEDGQGGLMAQANEEIDTAVANLQGSLRDLDALESTIFTSTDNASQTLQDLCGDIGPGFPVDANGEVIDKGAELAWLADRNGDGTPNSASDCLLIQEAMEAAQPGDAIFDCLSAEASGVRSDVSPTRECGIEFTCELPIAGDLLGISDVCADISRAVVAGAGDSTPISDIADALLPGAGELLKNDTVRCRLDDAELNSVVVAGRKFHCSGGEMGSLIQELAVQETERRKIAKEIVVDLLKIRSELAVLGFHTAAFAAQQAAKQINMAIDSLLSLYEAADKWGNIAEAPNEAINAARCVVIAGFSVGTDCTQSVVTDIIKSLMVVITIVARIAVEGAKALLKAAQTLLGDLYEFGKEHADRVQNIFQLILGIQAKVNGSLESLQGTFNTQVQIENIRFKAADAAVDRHDELSLVVDHLVGRERGNILVGDHMVGESGRSFRRILDTAYRMTVAFNHRYNLPAAQGQAQLARILQAVTLDDVQGHIDGLTALEREYCGREAIDCDAFNNLHIKRISLRETLFPDLRDVVDAGTGEVLTAGQRFHNIITSPPFLKRRVRGVHIADQIELPFSVWLQSISLGDETRWMLNPLTCNHVIDGDDQSIGGRRRGTVAVNVIGRNLEHADRALHYELLRGHIDQLRDCHAEPVQDEIGADPVLDYPIRTHTVGYAPQSVRGQSTSAPSYVARASDLAACVNAAEHSGALEDGDCWHYFARDRSLAAPDWRLTIPLSIGGGDAGNRWISGEGLPEAARPVIEDIVLYVRHRTRPIQED